MTLGRRSFHSLVPPYELHQQRDALLLAATNAPTTSAGRNAAGESAEQIETADLEVLANAFDRVGGRSRAVAQLAPQLLARARENANHPRCGRLLAACCTLLAPEEDGEPPELFREAADLIAQRYAASPDIHNFCEALGGSAGIHSWARRYERHLRAILEVNQNRKVRCAAQYALASVIMAGDEERQGEAEALFEKFCSEFDGTFKYPFQGIEQFYRAEAEKHLAELRFRAAGKLAPEIDGLDLDGKPMKLSDYRGRMVLLNFWGELVLSMYEARPTRARARRRL